MNRLFAVIGTGAVAAGLAAAAVAQVDPDIAAQLDKVEVSLIQAIEIAENHQGGVAYEAKLDDDRFAPEYEVEVTKDGLAWEITIDGVSGEVLRVKEERDD